MMGKLSCRHRSKKPAAGVRKTAPKPSLPPKRQLRRCASTASSTSTAASASDEASRREAANEAMCTATHQCGLVGGEHYDSKETRLGQLLERLPLDSGAAVVFVSSPASASAARAVIAASQQANASVIAVAGRAAGSCLFPSGCQFVINYDLPSTGREYVRRLGALSGGLPAGAARVCYTFILEDPEVKSRACRELIGLLRRAQKAVATDERLGGAARAAEFEATLGQLVEEEEEEDEEEEEGGGDDDACDCNICHGCALGSMSHHHAPRRHPLDTPNVEVEVVRLPLKALERLEAAAPYIAPRCSQYACTVICLHMLYCHTPWDSWEFLFANLGLGGTVRVVLLLADEGSWHDYPDHATLGAGGVAWCDILDVELMERTDGLLEKLVDYETELLGGRSERIVLFGASQGGGQSMLRFLRSKRRLGGWVGAVCHAPTAPHTQRHLDPLAAPGRPLVNCDRPIRLLAGENDSVFPPGLVRRDAERLRAVGGFSDVHVEVQPGLRHDDWDVADCRAAWAKGDRTGEEALSDVPELVFLRKQLRSILSSSAPASPARQSISPERC